MKSLPSAKGIEDLLITAIICALFEKKFADQKTNWNLIAKKARNWIKKEADALGVQVETLDQVAAQIISSS